MEKPLILIIEETRKDMIQAINNVTAKSGIPAFLLEGIILEVLSDIRNMKNRELTAAIEEMNEKKMDDAKEKR